MNAARREKQTWRKRLSRARHTKHANRALIPLPDGMAIGNYDREDDYPRIIRAPWTRIMRWK